MRHFQPGDRVLCIDAAPVPAVVRHFFKEQLEPGRVYTVRAVCISLPGSGNPGNGLYLEEIINDCNDDGIEYGWLDRRFIKIDPRYTLPERIGVEELYLMQ